MMTNEDLKKELEEALDFTREVMNASSFSFNSPVAAEIFKFSFYFIQTREQAEMMKKEMNENLAAVEASHQEMAAHDKEARNAN